MITQPTVLVLGAAASMPYGFPLGQKLLDDIATHSGSPGYDLRRSLLPCGFAAREVDEFHTALDVTPTASIDAFLVTHPECGEIGKHAIAARLLPREHPVHFLRQFRQRRQQQSMAEPSPFNWYQYLFSQMHKTGADFADNKLTVITFNYDQSFEQFMYTAVREVNPNWPGEKVAGQVSQGVRVIHVYGSLGKLPWQRDDKRVGLLGETVGYGEEANAEALGKAAKGIKLIQEVKVHTPVMGTACGWLKNARCIYFLGFAYHRENMERLGWEWCNNKGGRKVMGTAYGIDRTTCEYLDEHSQGLLSLEAKTLHNVKIEEFLRKYVSFHG